MYFLDSFFPDWFPMPPSAQNFRKQKKQSGEATNQESQNEDR